MKKDTIVCPQCGGFVGRSWRGQDLTDALERHLHLGHGLVKTVPPPKPSKIPARKTPLV